MTQNTKLYYILPAVVLIIIVVVILLIPKKQRPTQTAPTPTANQIPTLIPSNSSPAPTKTSSSGSRRSTGLSATPTLIPANYTGVIENQNIPQSETDLAVQKSTLRRQLPLTQPGFTVTYDYGNDQFVVTLSEPKDTNKTQFNQWLQANYSNIPVDRFIFK